LREFHEMIAAAAAAAASRKVGGNVLGKTPNHEDTGTKKNTGWLVP
jgi:hypothetical protein